MQSAPPLAQWHPDELQSPLLIAPFISWADVTGKLSAAHADIDNDEHQGPFCRINKEHHVIRKSIDSRSATQCLHEAKQLTIKSAKK
jgi:hypothetical protein